MRAPLRVLSLAAAVLAAGAASAQEEVPPDDILEPPAEKREAPEGPEGDALEVEPDTELGTEFSYEGLERRKPVESITVTANRREELVQDVPISMVALGSEFLEATDLTQFARLQDFVPNLRITPVTDSRSTSVRIRGIGSTGTNAGVDPSVGVFVDGVYQGRAGMSTTDFLDIERVEVLRGPQGTLFGKNTAAGAIQIISKRPGYEFESMAESIFSDYDGFQFRGSANLPLIEDQLATRFSGYWVTRDGFDTNRFDGATVNDNDRWGMKARMLVEPIEPLDFLFTVDYARTDSNCCYPDIISYQGPPALGPIAPGLPPTGPTFNDFAANRPAGDRFATLPVADPFDRVIGANRRTSDEVKVGGVSGEFDLELGDHDVTWLSAWRKYTTDSRFDGDFSVYDGVVASTEASLDQASTELRLTSPAGELFDYVGGLYFYYQTQNTTDLNSLQSEYIDAAPSAVLQLANVFVGNAPLQPIVNIGDNQHETWTLAGYGDGTLNLGEKWSLTGGLRLTHEYKSRKGTQTSTIASAMLDQPPLLGPDIVSDQDRSKTNLSSRLIVRFYPIGDVMTYASFASGFKSGGFNQLRTAVGVPSEFDDETSYNWELGTKTTWLGGRLLANLTGFYTLYDDFQAQSFDGSTISIRNAAELESYGFEGELTITPTDELILGTLVGFDIAEYLKFKNAECVIGNAIGCTQDLSGRRLDNAPRWSISSFAQYDMPVPLPWFPVVWYTRVDYSFNSPLYLSQDLDPNLKQGSTNILDLRTGLRDEDQRWEASFWVRNTLDDGYNIVGFDVPAVSGYAGVNGPPRQLGGTVRVRF